MTAMVDNCGSPSTPSLVSNQVRLSPFSPNMALSPLRAKPNHAAAAAMEAGPAGKLAEPDVSSQLSYPSLSTSTRLTRL